jgi:hypothetical protein
MSFFEPLPPPLDPVQRQRMWAPPAWDRPSEGTLPATLAVDALLDRSDDAVWSIPTLDVFPNGFRINVALMLNPRRQDELQSRIRHRGPMMGMVRVGVRFSDGRSGGRGLPRGPRGMPTDDEGIPTEPFVGLAGGGGGMGAWRFSAWVFPLPPVGPVEIFVSPPVPAGTGEFTAVVEGTAIRAAAERALVVWS